MSSSKVVILSFTHLITLVIGFALGIYLLPILTAPDSPTTVEIQAQAVEASYTTEFVRDLEGSDALHWGDGKVTISDRVITFDGNISPGPDFKLYLSPEFVETEADFEKIKSSMVQVGDVKTFDGFIVDVDSSIDIDQYTTVIIWCESFGEFITAAEYQRI